MNHLHPRRRPSSMAGIAAAVLLLLATGTDPVARAGTPRFDDVFTGRTMRVDLYHTGGPGPEILSLDRVVDDGAWAGSRTRLLDTTNLGTSFFEVVDVASKRVIYSRGFASVYGEWATTPEARKTHRTFSESLRLPWPRRPVRITLEKRGPDQEFHKIWTTFIDPGSRSVNPSPRPPEVGVEALIENGPPATKVDLVIVADGYTARQMPKFRADAARLVRALFAEPPFSERRSDFNVWLLPLPVAVAGISRPQVGRFRRNRLGTTFNIFDSERYLLTLDDRALRDAASAAPYEFVEILVNEKQYGGGGIFNAQAATSVDSEFAEYVFVHEFGHHFAALADEYYTSPVAYETGGPARPEPWEPNITALADPARLKWGDLVEPGTPVPTPWEKKRYEDHARLMGEKRQALIDAHAPEAEFDALFRRQRAIETGMLSGMRYSHTVGAFEGASYEATGLFRPTTDCIMFSRDRVGFCPVCRRAISRIIDLYARPEPAPAGHPAAVSARPRNPPGSPAPAD
ncbi:MAG: IgA Peptidase M64 [Acidobacteriota bacterium]